jgi:hypothetical protein
VETQKGLDYSGLDVGEKKYSA